MGKLWGKLAGSASTGLKVGGRERNGWSQNAGHVILLEQVTLCYGAVEALIAETLTNCTFIILCSA